jgi:hypothetical protein
MPHFVYGQHVEYKFQMRSSVAAWEKAYQEGKGPPTFFWNEKPAESTVAEFLAGTGGPGRYGRQFFPALPSSPAVFACPAQGSGIAL